MFWGIDCIMNECGKYPEIFHGLLSLPHNNVMNLNNVSQYELWACSLYIDNDYPWCRIRCVVFLSQGGLYRKEGVSLSIFMCPIWYVINANYLLYRQLKIISKCIQQLLTWDLFENIINNRLDIIFFQTYTYSM